MTDTPVKLDIGCSFYKQTGYIGLDILHSPNVDVQADARQMPFADSSIDEVYSSYALEHIPDNLAVISDLYRVCKPGAIIRLILPHFSNPAFSDDLTHVYRYSTRSFEHYDYDLHELTGHPNYLPGVNIKLLRAELRWWPPQVINRKKGIKRLVLSATNRIINGLANAHPFLCERIWCGWVGGFYEVDYLLRVEKQAGT